MAEADLLCELLMHENRNTSNVATCCKIRKFAFRFMTYKGSECFAAAATMTATTKEAKLMCEFLRNKCLENNGPFSRSCFIRHCTLDAMFKISRECSAVEESTGGSTGTKLIFGESNVKNCSGKELVNKDNQLERNEINQNTKICSEELPKGNHLEERNKANQNTKDERYDKSGSEIGIVGDNPGEVNETKQKTKEELVKGDNMKERSEKQKTKKEPLNGDNLNENEKQKIEENVVKQNNLEVDHKKHRTKLGDYLKTSSVEITTLLSLTGVQVGLVSRKPRAEQVLMSKSIIYYSRGAGGPEWLPKPVPTPATRVLAPVLAYREVPPLTFLLKKIIYYSKIYGYCSSP